MPFVLEGHAPHASILPLKAALLPFFQGESPVKEETRWKPKNLDRMPFGCWLWIACMIFMAAMFIKRCL